MSSEMKKTLMKELHPIITESVKDGGQFVFYPSGMSMFPTIKEKEDCVILTEAKNLIKYDLILYRRDNGQYVLHRIIGEKNGKYILCGDNQYLYERYVAQSSIIAMASEIRKPDGTVLDLDAIRHYKVPAKLFIKRQLYRVRNLLGRIKRRVFHK